VAKHQNKHIREAIKYAESIGWTVLKAGPRAHIWGMLYCPHHDRTGCRIRVMSTPKDPESHANDIRRQAENCPHLQQGQ
jgi:hypothetical protein